MKTVPLASTQDLEANPSATLVDTRLNEDFDAGHLPGARSNCVFEVAFLERMESIAADKETSITVYGAGPNSHESRIAADKLIRGGYAQVSEYREGLEGWLAAGKDLEDRAPERIQPTTPSGRFEIDLEESRLEWLGRNLLNKHWGTAPIRSGHFVIEEGVVKAGEFAIDLTALKCADLEGHELHDVLIGHLESDDFFDTAVHPEATFRITGSEPIPDAAPGLPNLRLNGELTLKGITSPLGIEAAAGVTPEGLPAAQASFSLDRTQWNVIYGSARFFKRLAGHLVNDLIEFQVRMVTKA